MFENMLKRAVFAAFAGVLLASVGCTGVRPPHEGILAESVVTGGTAAQRENVQIALGFLEEKVQRAVHSVSITNSCPNYHPKDADGNWQESAHTHPGTRDICIHPVYVSNGNVWHESGHALMMTRSTDDRVKFTAISLDAYGDMKGDFPRNGILTWYGAKDPWEDFAEWLRWAMCYLYNEPMGPVFADIRVVDVTDTRYLAHLQMLRDWGAISEAQYKQLEPLFTLRVNGAPLK